MNPYTSRRPSRPTLDGETILKEKANPIAATASSVPLLCETAHMRGVQAIVYGNAYTGYVKGAAEWKCDLECSVLAAGPFSIVGTTVLRSSNEGINTAIGVTAENIQSIVPGAKYFRLNATKVGAPGSLLYGAYLAPLEA
jgi:hypothetical protein